MKRQERDLVSLFNAFWYRDFPVTFGHEDVGRRAVWTTHIASIIKQCADMMGFFTCFESGGRTDAVIQTASRRIWANVEWEWIQPVRDSVNEIQKLRESSAQSTVQVFIGYSREGSLAENLQRISSQWEGVSTPLIVFLIEFRYSLGQRNFTILRTYYLKNGMARLVRQQPALPWQVQDTRWHLIAKDVGAGPKRLPDEDETAAIV